MTVLPETSPNRPTGLKTEGTADPFGIGTVRPRLSWHFERPQLPTSVVIEAATCADRLISGIADLWSTELSGESVGSALWEGAPLHSRSSVVWRVGLRRENTVTWSELAQFSVGLLAAEEWSAEWLTHSWWTNPSPDADLPCPVLGFDFTLDDLPTSATWYSSGAGVYQATINAMAAGDGVLAPGYSTTSQRLPAQARSVGSLLKEGHNSLRISLAPGISWVREPHSRYTKFTTDALPPRVLGQLELQFEDGRMRTIATNELWSAAIGRVLSSHWYGGEDQDARRSALTASIAEEPDEWEQAVSLGPASLHQTWWHLRPELAVVERKPAISVVKQANGDALVDFGVNIVGWPAVSFSQMDAGRRIEMWPSEVVNDEGTINQHSIGSPTYDSYVTTHGAQTWSPETVYHGFRYLDVRGLGDTEASFEARIIRVDNKPAGSLTTDDSFLNTLHAIIRRAVEGNMYSVFTDCPNREKLGWIEQLYLCFGAIARNYDVEAHLRDELQQLRDAQTEDGLVTSISPESADFNGIPFNDDPTAFRDDPNWGGAIVFLTLAHYREYGDERVLQENWQPITRFIQHLFSRSADGLLDFGLGDWIAIDASTPRSMVASFGYIRLLEDAATVGQLVGDHQAASEFRSRAASARKAFATAFRNDDGRWGSDSQGSYSLALDLNIVPEAERAAVFDRLLATIERAGTQVTVGENTWPSMIRVLHHYGRDDIINRLVRNEDGPGYGWQIKLGATALAESWYGAAGVDFDNSQNHFMLGMIDDWMQENIAGLAQAPDSTAWRRAHIRPTVIDGVTEASATYHSVRGEFSVNWSSAPSFRLKVCVPAGATATVDVPIDGSQTPHMVGSPHTGERIDTLAGAAQRFDVGSGEWEFTTDA
ncbi:family 78 glycoside hydrolase catalytic domain [Psychromicrobium xiongbiense]|uniref:family 78 glycoside hydrolase catalytic domain n=1 Tax=Psychromicrobium xiongbiense TaxID=3051184 RepID=UPI002554CA05|nr:family 78 glycoside hydrolase catalytic domain [Psychromicrobium sp. YIM S02556]